MQRAAITVLRSRDEAMRLWGSPDHDVSAIEERGTVTFKQAPADHGTEIHVIVHRAGDRAEVKDGLRRFKQRVETGIVVRSDASPDGESLTRLMRQRPAQPVGAS